MATSFKRFPLLPTELRLQVWAMAVEGQSGRVFHLDATTLNIGVYGGKQKIDFYHRVPPPVLASVSRESREVLMRHVTIFPGPDRDGPIQLFQPERDMLYLGPWWQRQLEAPVKTLQQCEELQSVKILAVAARPREFGHACLVSKNPGVGKAAELNQGFPNIEKLILVRSSLHRGICRCDRCPICIKDVSIADKLLIGASCPKWVRREHKSWRDNLYVDMDGDAEVLEEGFDLLRERGHIDSEPKVFAAVMFQPERCGHTSETGKEDQWMRAMREYNGPNVYE